MDKKKIVILGANGFLGRNIAEFYQKKDTPVVKVTHNNVDFENMSSIENFVSSDVLSEFHDVNTVYNCLGYNGGIEFQGTPDIFIRNTRMNLNALEFVNEYIKPDTCVSFIASCAYPDSETGVYSEENLFDGPPHKSVEQHAYAKRNLYLTCQYLQKHNFGTGGLARPKFYCICPPTLFGEYDKFGKNSKVVGALIYKILKAKKENSPYVRLLGTGNEKRQLLYVKDFAEFLEMPYMLHGYSLCNVESSIYVTIRDLARNIGSLVDYHGEILFLDGSGGSAKHKYIWSNFNPDAAKTPLYLALRKTINYAEENWDSL